MTYRQTLGERTLPKATTLSCCHLRACGLGLRGGCSGPTQATLLEHMGSSFAAVYVRHVVGMVTNAWSQSLLSSATLQEGLPGGAAPGSTAWTWTGQGVQRVGGTLIHVVRTGGQPHG